jgi:hypothetical protein
LKNATVLLLTVAFLFGWVASSPLPVVAETAAETDPAAILLEGLTDCRAVILLSGASLSVTELGQLYLTVLHSHPELFHVAPRLSYCYTEVTVDGSPLRVVTEVYPTYTMAGTDLTAARGFYRDALAAILAEMELTFGDHPRTEADTVLYLHDYLADRYTYDTRAESPNADTYTFLRDGRGICQAYALTFLALCRGAGLEAELVTSDAMDHAWNHVRVEGVRYHVDVTRDDPITPNPAEGEVNHARLLRSDRGMDSLGYHGYTCPARHACTDSRYESPAGEAALTAFRTPLIPSRGKWIGVDAQNAVVGVEFRKNGVMMGQVGDVNIDGRTDPADLLTLLDPALPEAWRARMRETLVGDGAP